MINKFNVPSSGTSTLALSDVAVNVAGTAGATAYTIERKLPGNNSTVTLISPTNANLTLSGLNIVPTAGFSGSTQIAKVREVSSSGTMALEYTVSLTGTALATSPKTTMPVATSLYRLDPDQISGADGSRVTGYTDAASGIAATANAATPLGPVLKTGVYNGHRALRFASVANEQLSLGRPASLTAKTTGFTVVVVVAAITGTGQYGTAFGSDFNTGHAALGANTGGGGAAGNVSNGFFSYGSVGDAPANLHTLIYSGDVGAGTPGRTYRNGVEVSAGSRPLLPGTLDLLIGNLKNSGNSGFNGPFGGDILWVEIFDRAFTPPEALQTHLWACNKHGVASPLAGRTEFNVFVGDSQTYGTGASPYDSYPSQLARKRGWAIGQWSNIGVPSIAVLDTGNPAVAGINSRAAAEVDAYQDVVGSAIKVNVIMGEWHNQGIAGGTLAAGAGVANNNRTFATNRKTAGKILGKVIGWTSHDSNREGLQRDGFNQSLVNTPGDFDAMIPVHTNTSIGVDGTVSANNAASGSTDSIHMGTAGYTILRDLIDAGMISAGVST